MLKDFPDHHQYIHIFLVCLKPHLAVIKIYSQFCTQKLLPTVFGYIQCQRLDWPHFRSFLTHCTIFLGQGFLLNSIILQPNMIFVFYSSQVWYFFEYLRIYHLYILWLLGMAVNVAQILLVFVWTCTSGSVVKKNNL